MSTLYKKKVLIINNKGYKQVKLLREAVSDKENERYLLCRVVVNW